MIATLRKMIPTIYVLEEFGRRSFHQLTAVSREESWPTGPDQTIFQMDPRSMADDNTKTAESHLGPGTCIGSMMPLESCPPKMDSEPMETEMLPAAMNAGLRHFRNAQKATTKNRSKLYR